LAVFIDDIVDWVG